MKYIFTLISLFTALCGLSQGAVQSGGNIKGTGNYPIVFSGDVKGGLHWTQTKANRDAIPTGFRVPGMVVYVQDSSKHYVLGNDLSTWGEWAGIEPGDKGDINVSTLSSWIIKNSTITTAKLADGIDVSKLASGEVTNTIFNYLKNVNGDIQTQFNNKVPTSRTITINGVTQSLSNNVSFTVSSDGGASGELITID